MTHNEFISLVKQPELVTAEHTSDLREMVERYPYFVSARLFLAKSLQQSHSIHFSANLKLAALYSSNRRWLYYYIHPENVLSTETYRRDRTGKSAGDYFDMLDVVEREGGDAKMSLKNLAERLKSARSMVMISSSKAVKEIVQENEVSELKEIQEMKASEYSEDKEFIQLKELKSELELAAVSRVDNVIFDEVVETNGLDEVGEWSAEFDMADEEEIDELEEEFEEEGVDEVNIVKLKPAQEDYFSIVEADISENAAKKLIRERKYKEAIEILTQLNLNNPKKSVYFADQIRFLEKIIVNSKK